MVIMPCKGRNKPESHRPGRTPSSTDRADERTYGSSHGGSYGSCAAARARPATSSKPSPSYKTIASLSPPEEEVGSVS